VTPPPHSLPREALPQVVISLVDRRGMQLVHASPNGPGQRPGHRLARRCSPVLRWYIDDVVIKSAGFEDHLANLRVALERIRQYGLRINLLKCAFSVSAGRSLGFVVHEWGIQIDPKKIESIRNLREPTCKREVQKLLGKINYLRRFISNMTGKIDSFLLLVRLKHEKEFTWGQSKGRLLIRSKNL
jgi:hypothetical protein